MGDMNFVICIEITPQKPTRGEKRYLLCDRYHESEAPANLMREDTNPDVENFYYDAFWAALRAGLLVNGDEYPIPYLSLGDANGWLAADWPRQTDADCERDWRTSAEARHWLEIALLGGTIPRPRVRIDE
jgi:hypothetical protein